jgi:ABC-type branched-subunit amino acid transport system ATPase component
MPQVFVDNLTVENFGPFYGRSTINFAPVEERCGILIGGKNGAGKTHLLRARFGFEKSLNRRAKLEGNDLVPFRRIV